MAKDEMEVVSEIVGDEITVPFVDAEEDQGQPGIYTEPDQLISDAEDVAEKQLFIDGSRDEVPPELQALAEHYVAIMRARMKMQVEEKTLKESLVERMRAEDVEEIETPTDTVTCEHTEADKIKVKMKAEAD